MKKYILILVKTSYSKTPYDKWLHQADVAPVLIVSSEFAKDYEHIENVYSFEEYLNDDLIEKEVVEIAAKYNFIGIFARAESDIIRAAKLREKLKLKGQNLESALAFRNKVIMKDYLKNSPVILPNYCHVDSSETIKEFSKKQGFPIVVKPVSESGSTGVEILNNENEMNNYLENNYFSNNVNIEVEEFIEGQMYHIDGLLINREIVFIQPYKYINDCLEYRLNNYLGGRTISPNEKIYKDLIDTVKVVVNKLPSPENMAFHAEIWEKKNGELVFCEIASRTGGATIGLSIEYGFDFNIDKIWFLVECGLYKSFIETVSYKPCGWIVIPPLKGVLLDMPLETKSNKYIVKSQYCGEIGERYNGGVKSGLFLAGYAISGDTENNVEENILEIANWFSKNSKWDLTV